MEKRGDLPVYEVTPEGRKGKSRILHRNLLLPCDFLQRDLSKPAPQRTQGKRRPVPATQGGDVYQHDGDGGTYLASQPPIWKFCQHQLPKQTIMDKKIWMAPKKICCLGMWRIYQNVMRTPQWQKTVLPLTLKQIKNPYYNKSQQDLVNTRWYHVLFLTKKKNKETCSEI